MIALLAGSGVLDSVRIHFWNCQSLAIERPFLSRYLTQGSVGDWSLSAKSRLISLWLWCKY
jgi:hypothetical protein